MELSHSLHRGVMETVAGGIINKFMQVNVKRRRNTLFFEDIIAEYIRLCEQNGHEKETFTLGQKWFSIIFSKLFSENIKNLPKHFVLNTVLCNMWKLLGIIDDMHVEIDNNTIHAVTYNDSIIRIIVSNRFYVGLISGLY